MSFEFFELQSINLENSVVRNPRVGARNRPTSRTIAVGCTGINTTDVYTGETGVNAEYLIEGSINGNIIKVKGGDYELDK